MQHILVQDSVTKQPKLFVDIHTILRVCFATIVLNLSLDLFIIKPAFASEASGKIEKIQEISDGRFVVFIENAANRIDKPNCLHPIGYFMIANENSVEGKKHIDMLRFAKKNNLAVDIVGTGTCKRWVDAEDINYLGISW
jgi:hypothetical protein